MGEQAVADVMNQRYYITPLLTRDLVGSFVQPQEDRRPIYQLTPRQREVLQLLAEGHSMKQAAAILNVSPRTIAFHKYRMMENLRVQSTAALVHFAVREGLTCSRRPPRRTTPTPTSDSLPLGKGPAAGAQFFLR
jgi:DNA-binding NarL/FixJ family response regulator